MLNNDQKELFSCRVCGLQQEQPPWGQDGKTPSFEICSCCGTEFGYNDATLVAIRRSRRKWLESGANWFEPSEEPDDWSVEKQLEQIPYQFR